MNDDIFDAVERAARSDRPDVALDLVAQRLRDERKYPQLFEALLVKKRRQIGLPLVLTGPLRELPEHKQRAYEDAYIEAAREVGGLFLADGNIPAAWPYFRAIGETAPVAAAIEKVEPREGIERVIEIAYYERANPRKGFELILAHFGTCNAITSFEQYPGSEGREECVRLLVRKLHGDLTESLNHAIARQEGAMPQATSIQELIAGRDWLFDENSYHIDTSHLSAVVRFSLELTDAESLRLAIDLTEYGRRLAPLFQYRGPPPFENLYADHAAYLRALAGDDAESAVAHFRSKIEQADPNDETKAAAQVLVMLLARLGRYGEAIDAFLAHLRQVESGQLACPSLVELCHRAGDRPRLMKLAREQGDLVNFATAALQS